MIYGCVAGVCCLALIGGGIAVALNQSTNNNKQEDTSTITVSYKEDTGIKVNVDLPDWNEDSTPALLEVNDGVSSTYQAIESKDAKDFKVNLNKSDYTIELISPINSDGSIYIVSDEVKITINDTNKEVNVPINGSKLPAEDVTDDQIKDIQKKFDEAKEQGKVDQLTVDKVNKNADAGKDARESKSDDEKKEAQESAKEEVKKTESTGSHSSTSSSSYSSSSSSNSGSSSSSGAESSSTPIHTHSWTPMYSQVYVVDQEAYDEPKYELRTLCTCGENYPSLEHLRAHALAHDGYGATYEDYVQVGTTHHNEVGHYENVISGYTCSCGATK